MVFEIGTLADYIKVQGGFAYKSQDFQNLGTNKVLKIKNVRFGHVDYNDTAFISDKLAQDTFAWSTKEGDLLISMTGSGPNAPQSLVGRVARVWAGEDTAWINQRVGRIVLKEQGSIHPDFIFYLLSQQSSQDFLVANSSGSANQANISGKTIEMLPCPIVSYEESAKIASILLSLDKKILLNRQINQTLEQMAQALFKSWFVDFDPVVDNALDAGFFEQDLALPDELLRRAEARRAVREPGEFKQLPDATRQLFPAAFEDGAEPSVGLGGWVPKGWQVQSIKDFANVTDFVANGSFAALKENVTLFDNPEYALYIRTTDFKNDFDKEKAKYIDKHAYEFLSKTKLSGAEVIISNVGDVGTVFRPPSWLGMPMTLGSNAIAISTQSLNDYLYFYFSSQAGQSAIDGIVSGSAQQKFNKTGFRSLRLLLPSNNVVIKFNEVYKDISSKIISNKKNIRHLELLRDTLLPKLISGELRLDNIDAELAKVDVA